MRTDLPAKPDKNESAIVNLDAASGPGTHWVAYIKRGSRVLYYDSFGNLRPPQELLKYFGSRAIVQYNHDSEQSFNTSICGHLCLKFLYNNS